MQTCRTKALASAQGYNGKFQLAVCWSFTGLKTGEAKLRLASSPKWKRPKED
jgi:hypothetical protein